MGVFSDMFSKAMQQAEKKAIGGAIQAINGNSARSPASARVTDALLASLISAYCDQKGDKLKIDVVKMKRESIVRGEFETKVAALLDGLMERGGVVGGRKVVVSVLVPKKKKSPSSRP